MSARLVHAVEKGASCPYGNFPEGRQINTTHHFCQDGYICREKSRNRPHIGGSIVERFSKSLEVLARFAVAGRIRTAGDSENRAIPPRAIWKIAPQWLLSSVERFSKSLEVLTRFAVAGRIRAAGDSENRLYDGCDGLRGWESWRSWEFASFWGWLAARDGFAG